MNNPVDQPKVSELRPQTKHDLEHVDDFLGSARWAAMSSGGAEAFRLNFATRLIDAVSYLSALPQPQATTVRVTQDVVALVRAARIVAFEDQSPAALRALDTASEAFADRVPWNDEPAPAPVVPTEIETLTRERDEAIRLARDRGSDITVDVVSTISKMRQRNETLTQDLGIPGAEKGAISDAERALGNMILLVPDAKAAEAHLWMEDAIQVLHRLQESNPVGQPKASELPTVSIKRLEWAIEVGNVTGMPVWRAESIIGRYTVTGDLWWGPEPTNDWANAASVDDCKAAAQADYERCMAEKLADGNDKAAEFKSFLIAKSADPASGISATERALYALLSLPKAAQALCTEAERETVIRTVEAAIRAAALNHKSS